MRTGRVAVALLGAAALLTGTAAAAGAPPQRTWHADQARVPDARAAGRGGEGVTVAVLDTWVDAAHPDFEGRVLAGADCTGGSCRDGAPAPDECTHGTHVAGTVASSSYGVAPKATVLPVKVLAYTPPGIGQASGSCSGSVAAVAAGIRYAVSRGARVLNLSLGTLVPGLSSSSDITAAVADAARAGAVVVFAAGNSSVPVADSYGGDALIVAATGPGGGLATYSQRGAGVSLAAPGGDPPTLGDCSPSTCVTSLYPGGRYAVAAGTSMAAPHVAGTAALLLGQDPRRTRQQVVDRLLSTARAVPGGGAGRGLLDATAALAGAAGPQPGTAPAVPAAPAAGGPGPAPAVATGPGTRPVATPSTPPPPGGSPPPAPGSPPGGGAAPGDPVAATPLQGTRADAAPAQLDGLPAGLVLLAAALVVTAGGSTLAARSRAPGR